MKIEKNEKIVDYWNSSSGTVAVVQSQDNLLIKINGHYTLGATRTAAIEKSQTVLPLLLHPGAKSIYYLGLGTGITASEGLNSKYDIKRSVVTELIPDVIKASQKYFKTYTTPLFTDSRSEVVHADGRQYLASTREKFDIINSDLFVLYRKSVGSLFTLEHFKNARDHLNPGGIFIQWIPLYQLTRQEFYIIANTMTRVFPQVTLWRNHFEPFVDVVAMVGQLDKSPLLANGVTIPDNSRRVEMAANFFQQKPILNEENILLFYCGNVSGIREIFKDTPINTDDLPYIEYLTPKSSSMQAADKAIWFSGPDFIHFLSQMLKSTSPEMDPVLNKVSRNEINRTRAGFHLARTYIFYAAYNKKLANREKEWLDAANKEKENFRRYWIE